MNRDELETAWSVIAQTNEDGNFKIEKKGAEWKVTFTSYMDASLAHYIMKFMAPEHSGHQDLGF